MAKQWRIFAHPGWFTSFREVIPDRNRRYELSNAIEDLLRRIENPSVELIVVPNEPDQYEFDVLEYTILVRWQRDKPDDIVLLGLY